MVRYVGLENSEEIQHTDNTADCDEVTFPPPGAISWSRLGTGDRLHVTVVRVWLQVPSYIITVQCTWVLHYTGPRKLKLGSRKVGSKLQGRLFISEDVKRNVEKAPASECSQWL